MSFEDFCSHFTNATMCHVLNTSFFSLSKRWHVFKHNYQWSPGSTAGGCVENRSTFLKNPQVLQSPFILITFLKTCALVVSDLCVKPDPDQSARSNNSDGDAKDKVVDPLHFRSKQ